ncbi:MAG: hypothetical protein SV765_08410 [Pseudomonadota bacterium]|nr:hypothetical protein [Pseudomonadota bacterium]
MGFIQKYILPKEVDLTASLQVQASATRKIVHDLYAACVLRQDDAFSAIRNDTSETRKIKDKNMQDLLDVFIAPYDKESIFRLITQLDWVALSIKHFVVEVEAYRIDQSLDRYRDIFELLREMASLLEEGLQQLSRKALPNIAALHDKYDQVVESRASHGAEVLREEDCRQVVVQMEILSQLKEVAKRMHVTADTLEDMAIKIL